MSRTRYMSVQERYDRDALFHKIVDALEQLIGACEMTPTEVREAAVFACTRFELLHPRSFGVHPCLECGERGHRGADCRQWRHVMSPGGGG